MIEISDMIVALWLLPVMLFVTLPLGMLCVWSIARLTQKMTSAAITAVEGKERAGGPVTAYPAEV